MKYKCGACGKPVNGLLWLKDEYLCWPHFLNMTAMLRLH